MSLKLLLLAALIVFLTGCCTMKYCEENADLEIALYGFDPSEIDTIYTTGYEIGSSFTTIVAGTQADTAMPRPGYTDQKYVLSRRIGVEGNPATLHQTFEYLSDKCDWKIYIPSISRTFLIDRYGYKDFKCNRCFPASPAENKKHSLTTCAVNGVFTNVNDIRINR